LFVVLESLLDGLLGNAAGASLIGGKLGMLVNFGGVSVFGADEPDEPAGGGKNGFEPEVSSELLGSPVLVPKPALGFKPEPGVEPPISKFGIETSMSIFESLASIF
jgi:hypothetical protein